MSGSAGRGLRVGLRPGDLRGGFVAPQGERDADWRSYHERGKFDFGVQAEAEVGHAGSLGEARRGIGGVNGRRRKTSPRRARSCRA
jgi:hypothetical protein